MSHLLSSVNPEAAAAIQPPAAKLPLPDVGVLVIYHMRRGHARQGRTRFPALVQGSREDGTLNLTVIMEAGELKNETLVRETGPGGDEGHVWERVDNMALSEAFRGTITALIQRVADVEQEMASLRSLILGDYDAPAVSIIHIMQDFENRLRALKVAAASAPAAPEKAAKRKRK